MSGFPFGFGLKPSKRRVPSKRQIHLDFLLMKARQMEATPSQWVATLMVPGVAKKDRAHGSLVMLALP